MLPIQDGETIRINAEQMDITGVDIASNEITVQRGAGGTTVTSHAANARDLRIH